MDVAAAGCGAVLTLIAQHTRRSTACLRMRPCPALHPLQRRPAHRHSRPCDSCHALHPSSWRLCAARSRHARTAVRARGPRDCRSSRAYQQPLTRARHAPALVARPETPGAHKALRAGGCIMHMSVACVVLSGGCCVVRILPHATCVIRPLFLLFPADHLSACPPHPLAPLDQRPPTHTQLGAGASGRAPQASWWWRAVGRC